MDATHEICISIRGHETRLPGLDKATAEWLAAHIGAAYPHALIERAHGGLRYCVSAQRTKAPSKADGITNALASIEAHGKVDITYTFDPPLPLGTSIQTTFNTHGEPFKLWATEFTQSQEKGA